MARKPLGLPAGIEIRGDALRIRFTWNGERRGETLAHPPTTQGIKAAARLRDQVVSLIKHGVLDEQKYAEIFPDSELAGGSQATIPNFGDYAQLWLNARDIVKGTRKNYVRVFNLYWMPGLGMRRMDLITPTLIRSVVAEIEWSSPGVKRIAIIRLASVFKTAVADGLIPRSPTATIDKPRQIKKMVDPYTRDEAEQLIEWMYANMARYSQVYAALFEFLFFTGLPPGEAMALQWDDIDERARTAQIRRIIIDRGPVERVKTKQHRQILLNERALHALSKAKRMATLRKMASKSPFAVTPYVFPPTKGGMWINDTSVTIKHFRSALDALGIRHRRQYDTRHTYATMCLMAGMNTAFIANQLGHSVEMLLSTYAKWISSASDWKEVDKLPARL